MGTTIQGVFAVAGALVLVSRWATLFAKGKFQLVLTDHNFLFLLAVLALLLVVAVREALERRRLGQHRATE